MGQKVEEEFHCILEMYATCISFWNLFPIAPLFSLVFNFLSFVFTYPYLGPITSHGSPLDLCVHVFQLLWILEACQAYGSACFHECFECKHKPKHLRVGEIICEDSITFDSTL